MRKFQCFMHAHGAVVAIIAWVAANENLALSCVGHLVSLVAIDPLGITPCPSEGEAESPEPSLEGLPKHYDN
jgi:hypothetical protein